MKKLLYPFRFLIISIILLAYPYSLLADWTVVATYELNDKASGLAWDGTFVYYGIYGVNGSNVYKFDPATGDYELVCNGPMEDAYGLTWDGQFLWSMDHPSSNNPGIAYQFDLTGTSIYQFECPATYMGGIAYDDGLFWLAAYYDPDGQIYLADDQGTVLKEFPTPGQQPWDICLQDEFLWIADYNDDMLYKVDTVNGTLIESHPCENIKPAGIVYDGQYLWYVDGQLSSPSTLYKVDLGGSGTPQIDVPITEYNYGIVALGDSATWNCIINNTGAADLEIANLVIQNAVPIFHYMTFPMMIAPGNSTDLELIYKPTESGPLNTTAVIETNDPVTPEVELTMTGDAVYSGPHIEVNASTHNYGDIRLYAMTRWFLEITNNGNTLLEVSEINFNNEQFLINDIEFPLSLGVLETEQVGIWFHPLETGSIEGTATIFHNDASQSELEISLQGESVDQEYPIGDPFWNYTINTSWDNSIKAITTISDISGDNVDDVIICSEDGFTRCFNGNASGMADILWENEIGSLYQQNGLTTIEDINDDGYQDVIVGLAGQRAIKALSGKTGEQLWAYYTNEYGDGGWVYQVWAKYDYNQDDIPDVLAATGNDGNNTGPKRIFCFDGTNGEVIWDAYTSGPNFSVIGVEDFNGDGHPDVIGGGSDVGETQGKVFGINGQNGSFFWNFTTPGTSVWALEQLDDATGDGIKDIVAGDFGGGIYYIDPTIGDPFQTSIIVNSIILRFENMQDVNDDGYADISIAHSGTNAFMLNGFNAQPLWVTSLVDKCWSIDKIPDVDGDGIDDIIAGTLSTSNYAYFLDGANGDEIHSLNYNETIDAIGAIPDINGDGSWEMVVGGRDGKLYCYSGGLNSTTLVADFTADTTFGYAPHTVQFTDLSLGNITSWEWDFDNNGIIDSQGQNPEYTYESQGVYSVSLSVSDGINTNTIVKTEYITVETLVGIYDIHKINISTEPNPFSSYTLITISTIENEKVNIKILDANGKTIKVLQPVNRSAHCQQFRWDRTDANGNNVNNGIYLAIATSASKQGMVKILVQ
jgi:PKD repeat protein